MFINQADLAFNITLEILQGCGYSCSDCAIDKNFTPDVVLEPDVQPMLDMVDEMKDFGYNLTEFTIGPTDIISARNGMALLDHPLVLALAERYDSLTVSLALLSDLNLKEFAEKISVLMKGKQFRLVVPVTLKNLHNAKYLNAVRKRLAVIVENLHDVEFKNLYLNLNMIGQTAANFDADANRLAQGLDLGVPKVVEFAFPHSRRGFNNLMVAEELKRDLMIFAKGIGDCNNTEINHYLITPIDDSYEVTYRNGQLYYTPFLIEKFPIFSDKFAIPKPWSADNVNLFKESLYYENLTKYIDNPICSGCCFVDQCARGDTHSIMDQVGATSCILNMKNRWDLAPRK